MNHARGRGGGSGGGVVGGSGHGVGAWGITKDGVSGISVGSDGLEAGGGSGGSCRPISAPPAQHGESGGGRGGMGGVPLGGAGGMGPYESGSEEPYYPGNSRTWDGRSGCVGDGTSGSRRSVGVGLDGAGSRGVTGDSGGGGGLEGVSEAPSSSMMELRSLFGRHSPEQNPHSPLISRIPPASESTPGPVPSQSSLNAAAGGGIFRPHTAGASVAAVPPGFSVEDRAASVYQANLTAAAVTTASRPQSASASASTSDLFPLFRGGNHFSSADNLGGPVHRLQRQDMQQGQGQGPRRAATASAAVDADSPSSLSPTVFPLGLRRPASTGADQYSPGQLKPVLNGDTADGAQGEKSASGSNAVNSSIASAERPTYESQRSFSPLGFLSDLMAQAERSTSGSGGSCSVEPSINAGGGNRDAEQLALFGGGNSLGVGTHHGGRGSAPPSMSTPKLTSLGIPAPPSRHVTDGGEVNGEGSREADVGVAAAAGGSIAGSLAAPATVHATSTGGTSDTAVENASGGASADTLHTSAAAGLARPAPKTLMDLIQESSSGGNERVPAHGQTTAPLEVRQAGGTVAGLQETSSTASHGTGGLDTMSTAGDAPAPGTTVYRQQQQSYQYAPQFDRVHSAMSNLQLGPSAMSTPSQDVYRHPGAADHQNPYISSAAHHQQQQPSAYHLGSPALVSGAAPHTSAGSYADVAAATAAQHHPHHSTHASHTHSHNTASYAQAPPPPHPHHQVLPHASPAGITGATMVLDQSGQGSHHHLVAAGSAGATPGAPIAYQTIPSYQIIYTNPAGGLGQAPATVVLQNAGGQQQVFATTSSATAPHGHNVIAIGAPPPAASAAAATTVGGNGYWQATVSDNEAVYAAAAAAARNHHPNVGPHPQYINVAHLHAGHAIPLVASVAGGSLHGAIAGGGTGAGQTSHTNRSGGRARRGVGGVSTSTPSKSTKGRRGGKGTRNAPAGGTGGSASRNSPAGFADAVSYSSVLEDFKSSRNGKTGTGNCWTVHDIKGHVVEFCQDQNGSRFLQSRLDLCDPKEGQNMEEGILVLEELMSGDNFAHVKNDVFGNYVVQKLLEKGASDMRARIKHKVEGEMVCLSLQMYGCRVIQKVLETLEEGHLLSLLTEFHGHVLELIRDQNGNHVCQKIIEVLSTKAKRVARAEGEANQYSNAIEFIVLDVLSNVEHLSCHPYGCRVLQRMLEHCTAPQKQRTLTAIGHCHEVLLDDQYGNYVIQHVLQYGGDEDRDSILQLVLREGNGVLKLSRQKFASNVVEKLLQYGSALQRNTLVLEMLQLAREPDAENGESGSAVVLLMVRDPYANYVVQTTLDVIPEGEERQQLLNVLNANSEQLRNYTFAKHIVSKLCA